MSLTREALVKWINYAKEDLKSAPPDGMLAFIVEYVPQAQPGLWSKEEVEIIAVAYAKALQQYVRP